MSLFPVSPEKQKKLEEHFFRLGIRENDMVEEFVRGSGAGGQKINKTSVVVVLRHLPSGLTVRCQESRSQALNRFLARKLLAEKLEVRLLGEKSVQEKLREKIRRQKRRRSRRAKEKMLADKRFQSEKKNLRRNIMKHTPLTLLCFTLITFLSSSLKAETPQLGLNVVKIKTKGSWTEVMIAIENQGDRDAEFSCCTAFLENKDGYAIASLTNEEIHSQIYNKAKTGALVGAITGAGLVLGGALSDIKELEYAGLGVATASGIGAVVGEGSADKKRRELIIDDIMRNQTFPAGLKVAGFVYFPPKKKWPGSRKARAVHLTYKYRGKTERVTALVN